MLNQWTAIEAFMIMVLILVVLFLKTVVTVHWIGTRVHYSGFTIWHYFYSWFRFDV